ncbi:MXAN_6640 family putative metalloprotease [Nocardioides sp. cx-173]|uniref:MXAN_6640 family putative metalloprotease n=1 Tax=Nocardioides sp. cx-173 TaxID=2898796 RepID=UPI001E3AE278|nr:MXAN_6640 family putative metalloprotease [Nocardioides sp. cx-173]MCD4526561.1 DUF6055 domain-containing protein [Nocardioides sp. cx-173]UGB40656.1 DUF6055 domain-containing protein [Nocardioides sp. cx-173]
MRRSVAAILVALSTTVSVLPALATTPGASASASAPAAIPRHPDGEDSPQEVLQRAQRAFAPVGRDRSPAADRPDATLALRDLFEVRARLTGEERRRADELLARPSDGAGDPYDDGYTVPSKRKCSKNLCLHWVPTTADAPPNRKWALRTFDMMNRVWRFEVGKLGYRRPLPDVRHSSSPKFDVYLKDLGSKFIYGYCAPEYPAAGARRTASGFCVLDNDFARSQFGAPPLTSLRVTAAHEFFHAVQFAYDYKDDPWFMESTATWMEERFADSANDNRQYLPAGQVRLPHVPLDVFRRGGTAPYANWVFWEFLSERYGKAIVKRVWEQAGAFPGAPNRYSTQALTRVLGSRGGFSSVFAAYASANATATRSYPEGKAWPSATISRTLVLGRNERTDSARTRIDHMAAKHVLFRPDSSLERGKWRLRVKVDGPARASGARARLVVKTKKGAWVRRPIELNARGVGFASFDFSPAKVRSAVVTLVNSNTRFRCGKGKSYSCSGRPLGDQKRFLVKAWVTRRG